MSLGNNCPLCKKPINYWAATTNCLIVCECNNYFVSIVDNLIQEEGYTFDSYHIFRGAYGTLLGLQILSNAVLPLNKFNSIKKIEKLSILL